MFVTDFEVKEDLGDVSLSIRNSTSAMNAHRSLVANGAGLARAMERLSSGMRINQASDDAAGLSISVRMRAEISSLSMARRNVQDGISMVQTAEGALHEVHSMLQRARDLSVQWNGTASLADRGSILAEWASISNEIGRIAGAVEFNGTKLLDGSSTSLMLHIGASDNETLTVSLEELFGGGPTALVRPNMFFTVPLISASQSSFDDAIKDVSLARTRLGAVAQRLEHSDNALAIRQENLLEAAGRIDSADMAEESINLMRYQVMEQSSMRVLTYDRDQKTQLLGMMQRTLGGLNRLA